MWRCLISWDKAWNSRGCLLRRNQAFRMQKNSLNRNKVCPSSIEKRQRKELELSSVTLSLFQSTTRSKPTYLESTALMQLLKSTTRSIETSNTAISFLMRRYRSWLSLEVLTMKRLNLCSQPTRSNPQLSKVSARMPYWRPKLYTRRNSWFCLSRSSIWTIVWRIGPKGSLEGVIGTQPEFSFPIFLKNIFASIQKYLVGTQICWRNICFGGSVKI